MLKKIKVVANSAFSQNVALVFGGVLGAQLITIAVNPILTRLYGPAAYGLLGTMMATAALLCPIATLTYPFAITIPKSKLDAKRLALISHSISAFVCLLLFLVIFINKYQISKVLNFQDNANYLLFLPLMMFFLAGLEITQQWVTREHLFSLIAKVSVSHSLILNILKISGGLLYPFGITLVLLAIFASALQTIMLIFKRVEVKKLGTEIVSLIKWNPLIKTAKKYADFPLYRMPQVLMLSISQNSPLLLLTSFHGLVSAGQYSLARTVMVAPVMLIGNSVGSVFYPRINRAVRNGENVTLILIKVTLVLGAVALIPSIILFYFSPLIFSVLFGMDWHVAGDYASWLSIFFYFTLISKPALSAIAPLKLQKSFLYYEILSTTLKLLSFLVGLFYFNSDEKAVMLFSIVGAISNFLITIWVIRKSKSKDMNKMP